MFDKDDDEEAKTDVKYFNAEINKRISGVKKTVNGATQELNMSNINTNELIKVDIYRKDVKKTSFLIEYTIDVKNTGNKEGLIEQVIDNFPAGFEFEASLNPGWQIQGNTARYEINETIGVGETRSVKIILKADMSKIPTGSKINIATVTSPDDIDKENSSKAEILLSVGTGAAETAAYGTLIMSVLGILCSGVCLIKKYVL